MMLDQKLLGSQVCILSLRHLFSQLSVPFLTPHDATVAYNSLRIDAEPRKETTKSLSVDECKLHVYVVGLTLHYNVP